MLTGAKEIVSASNAMLNKLATGQVFQAEGFSYDMSGISPVEVFYYQQRNSLQNVIDLKAALYQEAYEIPWAPLPLQVLSELDVQRIEQNRKDFSERAAKANALCETVLRKKGHGANELDEIVDRGTIIEKVTKKKNGAPKETTKNGKRQKKIDDLSNSILNNSDAINSLGNNYLLYFIIYYIF